MANENLDLEDFLNEELLGIKPKKVKKKKEKLEWKEADTSEIFEQEDEKKKNSDKDVEYTDDENTRTGEEDNSNPKIGSKDDKEKESDVPKIEPDKVNHTTQGKKVMEVTLELSGQDYGTADIGDEEYASITGLSSLLSFFDVDTKKLQDPNTTTESLNLTARETISQAENTITLTMRTNQNDGTISINVLVNELGQPQDNMEQAITYFNNVYQTNILNVINKEVRG